jgi:predicted nucleotidyltransferase
MTFCWSQYKGNLKWLEPNTIYLTKYGSQAYGTNLPTSDLDIRGIVVAPKEYYVGFGSSFEQAEQNEPDLVIFDIRKFFKLAADCNPNALEIIFTDIKDVISTNEAGRLLTSNRNLFISKRCKYTFMGYAKSQMGRILTHKHWLLNPVTDRPSRIEYGLKETPQIPKNQLEASNAMINKKIDQWNWKNMETVDASVRYEIVANCKEILSEMINFSGEKFQDSMFLSAGRCLGFETNFLEELDKERKYQARLSEYKQYQHWLSTRNKSRAEMEAKFGYDTKHGMHLVRLMKMCYEILTTGQVNVRRADYRELLDIRMGKMSFEALTEWFEEQVEKIEEAFSKSTLQERANIAKLNDLCCEIVNTSHK